MRAAKHLGVWSDDGIVVDDNSVVDMMADIALFEPNQRKNRANDRFLAGLWPILVQAWIQNAGSEAM